MRPTVDLNCDMGESFGAWSMGNDADVMPLVSSINVACGFHAGDPSVMRHTVAAAVSHGVSIGAHPGLPDLAGFGRRDMAISPQEAYDSTVYQVGALTAVAHTVGARLHHVKPHGALYNMAAGKPALADAIARAVRDVNPSLVLMGLSGSALIAAGRSVGIATTSEVFADRNYRADGTLVPRTAPHALITDPALAAARVVDMVLHRRVATVDGTTIALEPDSICIHGDAPGAAQFAAQIRTALYTAGVEVATHAGTRAS